MGAVGKSSPNAREFRARPARRLAVLAAASGLFVGVVGCSSDEQSAIKDRCTQAPAPHIEWARCQLRGADLRNANLQGALIHDVDLGGANLTGANLSEASVANTEFEDAVLFRANLKDTLFSGGDIHLGKFCKTTMPGGEIANGDC